MRLMALGLGVSVSGALLIRRAQRDCGSDGAYDKENYIILVTVESYMRTDWDQ